MSVIAIKRNQSLSKILKINDEYEAFCIDEVALYLCMRWEASDKTYIEKWKEQSETLFNKIDSTKKKSKTKFDKF